MIYYIYRFHIMRRPTATTSNPQTIVIAGGGIAGLFAAILLARQGKRVFVRDIRPDLRGKASYSGRSVNFTLSARGREMLRQANLLSAIMKYTVPLLGRALHLSNNTISLQPYGNSSHEILHSIRRSDLHRELLTAALNESLLDIQFEHSLDAVTLHKNEARFARSDGSKEHLHFDLFLGADGAFSRAQELLVVQEAALQTKEISDWRYLEFEVPAGPDGTNKLNSRYLHLWPRKDSLVCAIPNSDGSFVGNLIMPTAAFSELTTFERSLVFMSERFGDLLPLIPGGAATLQSLKISDILTTSISRWHFGGKALLLGDACHAISPFLGQGMNAALEDASVLAEHLKNPHQPLRHALSAFQENRKPNTDALGELSRQHLGQLSTHLGSHWKIAGHLAELRLSRWLPSRIRPIYSIVAHSTAGYSEAINEQKRRPTISTQMVQLGLQSFYFATAKFRDRASLRTDRIRI